MIEAIIAAAAIGASLGNAWLCALVALGCSLDSKKSGLSFIAGRFIGLFVLGIAISALGFIDSLKAIYFLLIFGALTLAMGVFVLAQVLNRHYWHRHGYSPLMTLHRHRRSNDMATDGGEMNKDFDSTPKSIYVFTLGIIRGATPCAKMLVLAPLLISVDFGFALALVLVFALTSTIYPIIGFLSGNIIRQSRRHIIYIRVSAALLMIVLGLYFIINALGGPVH